MDRLRGLTGERTREAQTVSSDLAPEALGAERRSQFGVQDLQGYRSVVPQVVGEKHRGHAAPAQLAFEPVSVSQAALKPVEKVGHRPTAGRENPRQYSALSTEGS
jgi:hypothetical protein